MTNRWADQYGISRRAFVAEASSLLATATLAAPLRNSAQQQTPRFATVAFDGYAIFDATTMITAAESIVPGRGKELVTAWRTRQFEYQWLRTLGGRYADFGQTGKDALIVAEKSLKLSLSVADRDRLLAAQQTLTPWPDAVAAVRQLRAAGLRLAFLSNMSQAMLEDGARRAGFRDAFEFVLTTDTVRAAKPAQRAYQMAVDSFKVPREKIAFVAFAGWDAAGAAWYGYPTVWTNRLGATAEQLDAATELECASLSEATAFLTQSAR